MHTQTHNLKLVSQLLRCGKKDRNTDEGSSFQDKMELCEVTVAPLSLNFSALWKHPHLMFPWILHNFIAAAILLYTVLGVRLYTWVNYLLFSRDEIQHHMFVIHF